MKRERFGARHFHGNGSRTKSTPALVERPAGADLTANNPRYSLWALVALCYVMPQVPGMRHSEEARAAYFAPERGYSKATSTAEQEPEASDENK